MKHLMQSQCKERGSVLVIGMLTLVLLSLIGVSATTTSRIEVEISGNDKAQKEAFFSAELGLTVGEDIIQTLQTRIALNEGTTVGRYAKNAAPAWYEMNWNTTDSIEMATSSLPSGLQDVSSPPRYTLEERTFKRDSLTTGIGAPTGVYYFNVSSRGVDRSGSGEAVVQTIYAARYN